MGRTALVTGGNRGIGLEVCRQLAAKQFHVILTARRREQGEAACKKLREQKLTAEFVELDVSQEESVAQAASEVARRIPHLDVLVNNAGIVDDPGSSAVDLSPGIVRKVFETNALGALLVSQKFQPLLARQGSGRIINVSSGLGSLQEMDGGFPAYRISKAALNAVTRILAADLGPKGISVNSVSPGWVRTDMGGANATDSVEEGADTIVWLATEAPQEVTGQFLYKRKPFPW